MSLTRPRPRPPELVWRLCLVVPVCLAALARVALGYAVRRRRPGAGGRPPPAPAHLARAVERLGPASIKVAQILSTRADLLPASTRTALGRLYDQARFPPPAKAIGSVPARLIDAVEGGASGLVPRAAGSIACVFRARLRTGELVAVKVLRPGVARTLATDLALLAAAGRALTHLRRFRRAPLASALAQICDATYQQLDLAREATDLATLRRTLGGDFPAVHVPAVLTRWSDSAALVMEYVPGLRHDPAADPPAAQAAALAALRACFHLLFLEGLVHCDLHPGNLYLRADGGCVLLDAGFSYHLAPAARRRFVEFFHGMARGEGDRCAQIVLATATTRSSGADPASFRRDLTDLVARSTGRTVAEFDLARFATSLFEIQNGHGIHADPQFAFPILALLVLEGTLRQICPDVEFQREAMPYLLRGMMT